MLLIQRWMRWRRYHRVVGEILAARRRGHGVYVREWRLPSGDGATADGVSVIEGVIEWCRQTLGRCRRPYGLDLFELAVICATDENGPPATIQFRDRSPRDLYPADTLAERLRCALFAEQHTDAARGPLHLAAAIFSWGDAAHTALPA